MGILRAVLASVLALFGIVLTIPVLVVGLPFWAIAFVTRVFSGFVQPDPVPWQEIIEYYPTIGWKPKANLRTYGLADEVFYFTTDADGWRGRTRLEESEVVAFGDSYAFGYGVNDDSFFAELNSSLRLKAIGSVGYNMVQCLLWMERFARQLSGKLVIWFIYYGNDLYENLQPNLGHYRMPFMREVNGTGNWEIVTAHVNSGQWPFSWDRRYYHKLAEICSPTFLSQRAFSACAYLIGKGSSICEAVNARLVVMTIPETTQLTPRGLAFLKSLAPDGQSFDPDTPDKKIGEICAGLNIPFVALKNHLGAAHYKATDPHWNERGHRRVAQLLYGLYEEYGAHRR